MTPTRSKSFAGGLAIALIVLIGLIVGLACGFAFQKMRAPGASAANSFASPFLNETPATARGPMVEAVAAYRSKTVHSVEDHLDLLRTIDRWLATDPLECANALDEMGALGLIPPGQIAASFIDAYGGNAGIQMRKAKEIRAADLQDEVVSAVFKTASTRDAMGTLNLVAALPPYDWRLQEDLGNALGKVMDSEKIKAAMAHPAMNSDIMRHLMQSWAGKDTGAALAFFESTSEAEFQRLGHRKNAYYGVLEGAGDPEAQLAFFSKLPPGMVKTSGTIDALGSMVAKDPGRWEELAKGVYKNFASGIAATAAKKVVVNSTDAATNFLLQIPGEKAREDATKQAIDALLFSGKPWDVPAMVAWARSTADPVISRKIIDQMRFRGVPLPPDIK